MKKLFFSLFLTTSLISSTQLFATPEKVKKKMRYFLYGSTSALAIYTIANNRSAADCLKPKLNNFINNQKKIRIIGSCLGAALVLAQTSYFIPKNS